MVFIWEKKGNEFLKELHDAIRDQSQSFARNRGQPIRETTIRNYMYGVKRVMGKYPITFDDLQILKDKSAIIAKMNDHTDNLLVKRNIITAVIVVLRSLIHIKHWKQEEIAPIVKHYEDFYRKLNLEYTERINSEMKTKKEENNMLPYDKLGKMVSTLKKHLKYAGILTKGGKLDSKRVFTKDDIDMLQSHLVLSLYHLLPARRNEYGNVSVVKYNEFEELAEEEKKKHYYDQKNFLVLGEKKGQMNFVWNNYKTAKKYGTQVIVVPKKLTTIINRWLEVNKSGALLINPYRGTKMTPNGLSKYLKKVFKLFYKSKNISSCILRKMEISEVRKNDMSYAMKAKLAEMMGHSVEQQQSYVKK